MASSRSADPFAEHVGVMKGLFAEYHKGSDFESVAAVAALLRETQQLVRQREASVKQTIRGLAGQIHELEKSSTYPQPEGSHSRRIAGLKADISDIMEAMEQLKNQHRDVAMQQSALQERLTQTQQRSKAAAENAATEEPLLRHQLSLFAHISKINWRLDQESRILGTVSDPAKGDIRPIDIDPRSCGHFEAVNKLWQLM